MSKKVAFYCEAGTKRGLGHLIRSYVLYKKMQTLGFEADFFVDSDVAYSYPDIDYFTWDKFIIEKTYDVIVIDSYEAEKDIYESIAKTCKVPVYIDDFKRLDYPKGIIVNFAPDAKIKYYQDEKAYHTYLLGLDYIPIRELFFNDTVSTKETIFVMLGGSDILNLTPQIVKNLKGINMPIVVVVNNKKSVQSLEKVDRVTVLYKPSDIALVAEMKKAKLAISTASMSLYEFSFLRVPTIIIATSLNQKEGAEALMKNQLALKYLEIEKQNWLSDLRKSIDTILKMDTNLEVDYKIDGQGSQRIANSILELLK